MKKLLLLAIIASLNTSLLSAASEVHDRVVRSAIVLKEIVQAPDRNIPKDLLDKCSCVAVIPGMKKGGFIFGASYGKGVISCRTENGDGPWSAPTMLQITGGSFGLQIGVQSVDLILLIMNVSGIESLLDSKFTLGGDASVAAGPVGRTAAAETDAWMTARILAYSRSRGLFGGLVIKGQTIRPDKNANFVLYGKDIEPRQVLFHRAQSVPEDAQIFLRELTGISPKKIIK
ncbi:MAG: lipid-binding SYLF domain-containing protein [Acidobacteria bacterium]|nr:lipid-binding SYLF domain-containing protein [Acidobacteriota bacterium]